MVKRVKGEPQIENQPVPSPATSLSLSLGCLLARAMSRAWLGLSAGQVQAKDYELASTLERELAIFMRKNGMGFEGDP